MKASDLVHLRTQQFMSAHPGWEYEPAMKHVLAYDLALATAYGEDKEALPTADELAFAEQIGFQIPGESFQQKLFAQKEEARKKKQAATFNAGVEVIERTNKLAESRLAEGLPELTFSGLVQEVLDADPQLKADYTGISE